jgi:hypothetical protein
MSALLLFSKVCRAVVCSVWALGQFGAERRDGVRSRGALGGEQFLQLRLLLVQLLDFLFPLFLLLLQAQRLPGGGLGIGGDELPVLVRGEHHQRHRHEDDAHDENQHGEDFADKRHGAEPS